MSTLFLLKAKFAFPPHFPPIILFRVGFRRDQSGGSVVNDQISLRGGIRRDKSGSVVNDQISLWGGIRCSLFNVHIFLWGGISYL